MAVTTYFFSQFEFIDWGKGVIGINHTVGIYIHKKMKKKPERVYII